MTLRDKLYVIGTALGCTAIAVLATASAIVERPPSEHLGFGGPKASNAAVADDVDPSFRTTASGPARTFRVTEVVTGGR